MKQESPLNQIDLSSLQNTAQLSVTEVPFLGYVVLRADATNQSLHKAIEKELNSKLPIKPNTRVVSQSKKVGSLEILWYSPSEWLLITEQQSAASHLVDSLRTAFGKHHACATEVTGGNTLLEISGDAARDLLMKGTTLDLHESVFKVGDCAQTVFAKTGATLYLSDDAAKFRVIIRRSFGDYIGVWLLDAAQEFLS